MADSNVTLQQLPMPIRLIGDVRWQAAGERLTIEAAARTDWFLAPGDDATTTMNTGALVGDVDGDYSLSARVAVEFAARFDAGALVVYARPDSWAKLAFEYSPAGEPMIVSVVTRGRSDDANSFVVDGRSVWLRISRLGSAYAFHASTDGAYWQLVRHFTLGDDAPAAVGFEAQSPLGEGCSATFDQIVFAPGRLRDIRGGS